MPRRDIKSTPQRIAEIVEGRLVERTRIAYLAADFISSSRQVFIQFSDPLFTRGSTVKADLAAGLDLSSLPVGTPVTVVIRHGRAKIVGLTAVIPGLGGSVATAIERVYASKSGSQTISNNSTTAITFDQNDLISNDTLHDTTANTSRFVAPWTGCYHVSCWVRYGAVSAAGRLQLLLRDSAAVSSHSQRDDIVTTATTGNLNVATDIDLVAGDWIDWAAFQVTGASQDITLARATMRYVGA